MSIAQILQSKSGAVQFAECETPLHHVVKMLADHRIGAMPVLKDGEVVGIVSERDLVYGLAREGAAVLDRPVKDVMTTPVFTIEKKTEVLSALSLMSQRRIRHLPVVEGGRLLGIISIGDLVKYRMDQIEQEAAAMLNYIQMA